MYDDAEDDTEPRFTIHSPRTGITLGIHTNQPSVVMYTAGYLSGVPRKHGREGECYGSSSGLAVEQQGRVDAVNHPEWGEKVVCESFL